MQEVEDELLEEDRRCVSDLLEQFPGGRVTQFLQCDIDSLVGSLLGRRLPNIRRFTASDVLSLDFPTTFADHPTAGLLVEPIRVTSQQIASALRDAPYPGGWRIGVPRGLEHAERPAASMAVSKVWEIRQPLRTLYLTETHQIGNDLVDVASAIALGMPCEMT